MQTFPVNNVLIADGDYTPIKAHSVGRPVSIEVSGEFGGATVVAGYASADDVPVFVTDVGDDGLARPKTEAGRWVSLRPASGLPALRVTNATGTTAILVVITDLLPR